MNDGSAKGVGPSVGGEMAATIGPATRKQHTDAVAKIIAARLLRSMPQQLWHYTTGDNLIKILESGELWSTQVSCVNDTTEFKHAVQLSRGAFERRLRMDEALSDEHRALGDDSVALLVVCLRQGGDVVVALGIHQPPLRQSSQIVGSLAGCSAGAVAVGFRVARGMSQLHVAG
jgi:hypothetical protein